MKKSLKNTLLVAVILTKVNAESSLALGPNDYGIELIDYPARLVEGLKSNSDLEIVLTNPPQQLPYVVPLSVRHIRVESVVDGAIGKVDDKLYVEFSGRSALKSVTLPKDLKIIGDRAFGACKSLESITIPDSVTRIGNRAFAFCEKLTTVTIPSGVTELGTEIFDGCDNLKTIYAPKELHDKLRKSLPEVDLVPYSTSQTLLLDGTESYLDIQKMRAQKTLASHPFSISVIGTTVTYATYSSPMLQSAILTFTSVLGSSLWSVGTTLLSSLLG